jgi:hypothetical protein
MTDCKAIRVFKKVLAGQPPRLRDTLGIYVSPGERVMPPTDRQVNGKPSDNRNVVLVPAEVA